MRGGGSVKSLKAVVPSLQTAHCSTYQIQCKAEPEQCEHDIGLEFNFHTL